MISCIIYDLRHGIVRAHRDFATVERAREYRDTYAKGCEVFAHVADHCDPMAVTAWLDPPEWSVRAMAARALPGPVTPVEPVAAPVPTPEPSTAASDDAKGTDGLVSSDIEPAVTHGWVESLRPDADPAGSGLFVGLGNPRMG